MPTRRPTAKVYFDGYQFRIPNVQGAISLAWAVGQPIAGGSIRVVDAQFPLEIRMPVVVEWGFDWNHVYGFHGFVTNPQRAGYPKAWTIQVKDILWLADFAVMKDSINLLNNKTALQVMRILLNEYSGIPLSRIALPDFEQSPGVPWLLGTMTPIEFTGSPLQACIQICDVLGYYLYADEGGMIRARKVTGNPSEAAVAYWDEGRDWLVNGAPNTDSDSEKVYTRVIVTGAATNIITGPSGEQRAVNVRDSRQIDGHPYLPDGKHRELKFSSNLIEYTTIDQSGDASCEAVAERQLLEHSRTPFTVSARVPTDPRIGVSMTVAGRSPRVGIDNYRNFFLMGLQRTFGGGSFMDQVTLDGGVGVSGYTTIPPPTAAFIWTLVRETIGGVDYIEVFLDGGASKGFGQAAELDENGNIKEPDDPTLDPLYTIQSYAWSDDSEPPKSATGKKAVFMYPADQVTAHICLTVTDVTGKTDRICYPIALQGDVGSEPLKRELSVAAGASWYVTPDGGKTWYRENAQLTHAIPPISAMGSIVADVAAATAIGFLSAGGAVGGGLRSTIDYLATPSVTVNTGSSTTAASFIWQNEKYPERIWMAIANVVYLSIDSGVTFYPRGTFELPVTWIVESIDTIGVVDVLAGPHMYTTWDGQTLVPHWTATLEGPVGAIARNYASGFAKHWVGYTNVAPGQSPLRSSEGDIAAFPDVDPPVLEIRALTMMTDQPQLIAIDQVGRIWMLNETGSDADNIAVMPDAI